MPTYPATTYAEGVELTITSGNQLHEVINGTAVEEINTDSGPVPALRKALADAMLFKPFVSWTVGSSETDPFQPRMFGDILYWAPAATNATPIPMGADPTIDSNWFTLPIYPLAKNIADASERPTNPNINLEVWQEDIDKKIIYRGSDVWKDMLGNVV